MYRSQSLKMMRFNIHSDKQELFEMLGLQALLSTMQTTKRKNIKNIVGYYSGVLSNLIDTSLFGNAFKDYDVNIADIKLPY